MSAGRAESGPRSSFVVVANRLPVDRIEHEDGSIDWRTSPGGLVTALEPVMRSHDGAWVGWHGAADEELEPFENGGLQLVPVKLTAEEVRDYYEGFSNATLWPLYHDCVAHPEFHREWWEAYVEVNERFAAAAADVVEQNGVVWIQDYQLQLVPQMLRERRPDVRIGYFLHIPFPPTELYQQLPWRREILAGLLGADLVGFQTPGGARNFLRLVRDRMGIAPKRDRVEMEDGRMVTAKAYPISIDSRGFHQLAREPDTVERSVRIRHDLGDPKYLFLGVDRLDYTKGIYQRLRAFGELVAEGEIDPDEVVFVQVATPSRERVDQYRILRDEIDRLVGRINSEAGRIGRPPITYLHSSYPREEMAALYRAADVMVVTPLRDGMNLVAKEYLACRQNDNGALVLSEFTGAARELRQAYLVNPYDINGMKSAMLRALTDDPKAKARRMKTLRKQVFDHDIDAWADSFLTDLRQAEPLNKD